MNINRRQLLAGAVAAAGAAIAYETAWPKVVDLTGFLDPDFRRVKRPRTEALVVHCTSIGNYFEIFNTLSSLTTLLSSNSNAHYYISREGTIYKTVPEQLIASHAGVSRWGDLRGLNSSSIGIEFQGFPDQPYTNEQYEAFKYLYRDGPKNLRDGYGIQDAGVLFHSWVAYCPSQGVHNQLNLAGRHAKPHRGRKPDPGFLFDRRRAGIYEAPEFDPDVKSGLILPSTDPTMLIVNAGDRALAVVQDSKEIIRHGCSVEGPVRKGRFSIGKKIKAGRDSAPYIEIPQGDSVILAYDPDALQRSRASIRIGSDDFFRVFDNALLGTPVEIR